MYPAINVGPIVLPTAAFVYLAGIWLSLSLIERAAKKVGLDGENLYGTAVTGVAAGFVGARLVFVMLYWTAFRDNLLGIIWPINSGYNLWGGLFFGLAGAFFYGRARRLHIWQTLDGLSPGLLLGFITISLADFLAGPGFGTLSRVPWAISQFSMRRHPVQIYEILLGLAVLAVWWRVRQFRVFPGQVFLIISILYSGGRLFLDAYRANAWITTGGYHILQIISLIIMLVGLFLLGQFTFSKSEK